MKGCIVACAVLCAVVALVAVNAVYVRRVSDTLLDLLETLPDLPDPAVTPGEIEAVSAYLCEHMTLLSLSVNFALPDRIAESLAALREEARLGDGYQYTATLAILRDLCRDLARAEQWKVENIF